MKTPRIVPVLLIQVVLLFTLAACSNQMMPDIQLIDRSVEKESAGGSEWGAPQNLAASQGKKRAITLSWDPVDTAVRYYIYKSESPLLDFVQCGETADDAAEFELKVSPGANMYYKVAALNKKNETSPQSVYVRGSSLAQPVIYDVMSSQEDPNSAVVYWSMNNLEPDTYLDQVRYAVSCFENDLLKVRLLVDGAGMEEPRAVLPGLSANAEYLFQVEAYTAEDESAVETSEKMTAETARRLNPAAPGNPETIAGGAPQSVTLSFELPERVDVLEKDLDPVTGKREYVPHPLYFVVSRRAAGSGAAFETLCPYFGGDAAKAALLGGASFDGYVPGDRVSWTDNSILPENRGTEYEYRIQSYVDGIDKKITSPASIAELTGWAMKKPQVLIAAPVYTKGAGSDYVSAALPLEFIHNAKGVAYDYRLRETIAPIGDGNPLDPPTVIQTDYSFNLAQIQSYVAEIDLTAASSVSNKGRGFYSYAAEVRLGDVLIETVDTVGAMKVFEKNTEHIVVENFSVKDGYPDKFEVTWTWRKDRKYILKTAPAAGGPWTELSPFPRDDAKDGQVFTHTDFASEGVSRYFAITPWEGDLEGNSYYSPEAKTLGRPEISLYGDLSYDTVSITWSPAQMSMADNYRVTYQYSEGAPYSTGLISAASLTLAGGKYVYGFKPEGYTDAARAGKPLTVFLEALNEARRIADGGGEIKTVSNTVNTRLFGPAGLENTISADRNSSVAEIKVEWGEVAGAAGYYIVRSQYDMDNTAPSSGNEIFYYVNAADKTLMGKEILITGGIKEDTDDVSAGLAFAGGTYTLTDKALSDAEYNAKKDTHGVYADEQNDIPWGYPYRYQVVPVLSENDIPVFGAGNTCTVGGVTYTGTSMAGLECRGKALGFVQGVTATKGSYFSTSPGGEAGNDGIAITWTKPALIPEGSGYYVYRRPEAGSGDWTQLNSAVVSALSYIDTYDGSNDPAEGTVYEYLVGVSHGGVVSRPDQNARFLAWNREVKDDDVPAESKMAGYILPKPTMISASRTVNGDEAGYYEIVSWNAARVDATVDKGGKSRGIVGYAIEVRDQSSARNWQTIKTVEANQNSVTYTENLYNTNGLLNVLRDYRHYFRVRAYVDSGGEKIYSRVPDNPSNSLDGTENDYVKWGARQISAKEFAALTSLAIGTGLQGVSPSQSDSYKTGTVTLSNKAVLFGAVDGTLKLKTTANTILGAGYSFKTFDKYGAQNSGDVESTITFTANLADPLPFVYNGTVKIKGMTASGGTYTVTFNGQTDVSITPLTLVTAPFTFGTNSFKDCSGIYNWNLNDGWQ
jgi:hypothetical protein